MRFRFFVLVLVLVCIPPALAQSSTYERDPYDYGNQRNATKRTIRPGLAGYDPVALLDMRKGVKGRPDIYFRGRDGLTYVFADKENRKTFKEDKDRYMVAFKGNCPVTYHTLSRKRKGDHNLFSVYGDRIWLFVNREALEHFGKEPDRFIKDLPEKRKKKKVKSR